MNAEKLDKAIQSRGVIAVARDVQLALVVTLGWSRTYFLVHVALIFLATPAAYLIGYQSTFGENVAAALSQPELHPFTMLVMMGMRMFNWMCLVLPFPAIITVFWFFFTGMFQQRFWNDVAQIHSEKIEP